MSRDLWESVQDRLEGPIHIRSPDLEFAFLGFITCAHCGYGMTAERKKKKYIYYRCVKRCSDDRYVRETALIDMFGEHLKKLSFPESVISSIAQALKESRRDIRDDLTRRYEATSKRFETLSCRIDAAYEDKLDGKIDEALFQRKRAEWEEQRSAAFQQMERLRRADVANLDLGIQLLELANRCYFIYLQLKPAEKRSLLESLISNSFFARGELTVEWRKPSNYLAEMASPEQTENPLTADAEGGHPIWWSVLDEYRTFWVDVGMGEARRLKEFRKRFRMVQRNLGRPQ